MSASPGGPSPGVLGDPIRARVHAHLYDFGVVSLEYEIAIPPGTPLATLIPIADALYDATTLDARAESHCREVMKRLGDRIEKPRLWGEAEDFTVVFLESLRSGTLAELTQSEVLAKLLLGETSPKPLSAGVREDVLRNAFSYLADDLVVIDWNSAIVVEPSGSRVVPHVLEFATCQLLEFRFYDGLIDRELARVYAHVERERPRIFRSPYAKMMREVTRRFMELTEFTERVDNALKAVGDFYLARVYLAAIKRFRVAEWRESVEAKLDLVARAYEILKGEVEISRSEIMEIVVIVLILIEVISAIWGH